MTDMEILFQYRLKQAEDTLKDAKNMLKSNFTPQSIVNRAYYSVFYSLLALYIRRNVDIKTSKHAGIISIFDKEFVHKGIIAKKYSEILHELFELRQESDYREFVKITEKDIEDSVVKAKSFIDIIKKVIDKE